ncbi:MAG: hypothetical protein HKL87_05195 [Acidimicrobiaceae bacterium]|nr:hypothetical protein [Acidimicrobiaceae bacterium]
MSDPILSNPAPRRFPQWRSLNLDKLERNFSLGGGVVALISTLFFIPHLLHNTVVTQTQTPSAHHTCSLGYSLVKSTCQKSVMYHPSDYYVVFLGLLVMGALIAIFGYLRNRPAVAVFSLILGFLSGAAGILYFGLAGWLLVRGWRIHKFGDASFKGAASAARAQRATRTPRAPRSRRGASVPDAIKSIEPSKRYTPKGTRPKRS